MERRKFVKGTLAAGVVASSGLLSTNLWAEDAAAKPEAAATEGASAFDADNLADVMKGLGAESAEMSDKLTLVAPDVAENGAVVPVSVETALEGVTKVSFVAENNAKPLSASYDLGADMLGFVATRIRMGKSGKVIVLVTAGDKMYMAEKQVKVTAGGC